MLSKLKMSTKDRKTQVSEGISFRDYKSLHKVGKTTVYKEADK